MAYALCGQHGPGAAQHVTHAVAAAVQGQNSLTPEDISLIDIEYSEPELELGWRVYACVQDQAMLAQLGAVHSPAGSWVCPTEVVLEAVLGQLTVICADCLQAYLEGIAC